MSHKTNSGMRETVSRLMSRQGASVCEKRLCCSVVRDTLSPITLRTLEIGIIVGCSWLISIDRIERAVHVQREVDARAVERSHARIVVRGVVNSVNTNCVDPKLLKFRNVTFARAGIGDGIGSIGRSTRLIIDTTDVKSVATSKECY